MKICINEGCHTKAIKRGMCNKHYQSYYYNKNKESSAAKKREYYKKNKDKILEYQKRYFEKHPEKLKQYRSNSYYNNKEKRMESFKKYHKKYPEYSRMLRRRRRAKIKSNGYEKYTESQVLEMYGTECYLCKKPIDLEATRKCGKPGWEKGLHIEHVIDIALGGPDTLQNVRPSHGICNLTKKPIEMV